MCFYPSTEENERHLQLEENWTNCEVNAKYVLCKRMFSCTCIRMHLWDNIKIQIKVFIIAYKADWQNRHVVRIKQVNRGD